MSEFGKFLVIVGLLMAAVGAILWLGIGKSWFGRLPGDISYRGEHGTFYFPLVSCLVISIFVSLILWIINQFRR